LVENTLMGIVYASNQLVADGGEALGTYLEQMFAMAIEWAVEYGCFNGTGAGQIQGVVNSPATVQVTRKTPSSVVVDDVSNMAQALLPACYKRCVWACNTSVLSSLPKQANFFINGGWKDSAGLSGALLDRPLYGTEKLPVLGTLGDLVLFDPYLYVLGTRLIEVEHATEEPTAFNRNQTAFRLIWRGNGQPLPKGTTTSADGTTLMGGFVALK
jgi:HK97 family phage major capsid protein